MSDQTSPTPAKPAGRYAAARPKVPPFARYRGTSAFRKDRRRAREFARFLRAERAGLKAAAGA